MARVVAPLLVLLALVWFLAVGLPGLDRPGLNEDECFFLAPLLEGRTAWMLTPYLGGLKSLLYVPLLADFPTTPTRIRAPMLALGVVGLLLAYATARRFFGRRAALLAIWLLALDPAMMHHFREDYGPSALPFVLRILFLLALLSYRRTGRSSAAAWAGLIAGLGVWTKFDWLIFLFAALLAGAIFPPPAERAGGKRAWATAATAFLVGSAPAWMYWLGHPADVRAYAAPFLGWSWAGLAEKIGMLYETTCGAYPVHQMLGAVFIVTKTTLLPVVFLGGVISLPVLYRRDRARPSTVELPFLTGTVLLQSAALLALPYDLDSAHFFALAPAFHLAIAGLVFFFLDTAFADRRAAKAAALLLIVPLLITGLIASWQTADKLRRQGGAGLWSPRLADLAPAASRPGDRPVLLDWGMTRPLAALSGRRTPEELFWRLNGPQLDPAARQSLDALLQSDRALFIAHAPPREIFSWPRRHVAERIAELGLRYATVSVIADTDRKPLFILFRVGPEGQEVWPDGAAGFSP